MNSLDPWSMIATDPSGDVILPPARYGHPFYRDVPSWLTYGDQGDRRFLFEGAFVGADTPLPKRSGLTAALAPVVAPATGGITVKKELDDKQILHVEICVDGKCYQQSMDLAPAIAMLMQKLASWHEAQHATKAADLPKEAVVGCINDAVGQVTDGIVNDLIGCHCDTICGSFLGDIAGAVQGAVHGVVHGVGSIAGGIGSTLKKLKGPIAIAAAAAATAGAAAIPGVGPVAAPIAGKLAYNLVQSAAGDNKAKQQVQQAQQQAKTDPTVAVALAEAQKAVANATVAHHVQETAKQAAAGHPAAQQQIAQVQADASQGDPAAQAVQAIIQNALSGLTSSSTAPTTTSGQWFDAVGQAAGYPVPQLAPPDPAGNALKARWMSDGSKSVAKANAQHRAPYYGHYRAGSHHVEYPFNTFEDASQWFGAVTDDRVRRQKMGERANYDYLAIFTTSDLRQPLWQEFPHFWDPQVGQWLDVVGATTSTARDAIESARARGKQLASSRAGAAAGAIHRVHDGHWHVYSFASLDDAIDWLQQAAYDKASFTYAAAYEKGNDGEAYVQAEEFGHPSSQPLAPGAVLHRGSY
jgi:hypothetical protein